MLFDEPAFIVRKDLTIAANELRAQISGQEMDDA